MVNVFLQRINRHKIIGQLLLFSNQNLGEYLFLFNSNQLSIYTNFQKLFVWKYISPSIWYNKILPLFYFWEFSTTTNTDQVLFVNKPLCKHSPATFPLFGYQVLQYNIQYLLQISIALT